MFSSLGCGSVSYTYVGTAVQEEGMGGLSRSPIHISTCSLFSSVSQRSRHQHGIGCVKDLLGKNAINNMFSTIQEARMDCTVRFLGHKCGIVGMEENT